MTGTERLKHLVSVLNQHIVILSSNIEADDYLYQNRDVRNICEILKFRKKDVEYHLKNFDNDTYRYIVASKVTDVMSDIYMYASSHNEIAAKTASDILDALMEI